MGRRATRWTPRTAAPHQTVAPASRILPVMVSRSAQAGDQARADRLARMTPAERVELVFKLGEQGLAAYMTTHGVDRQTAIARIRGGDFRPTPSAFACADCPALDLVCAGPRLPLGR